MTEEKETNLQFKPTDAESEVLDQIQGHWDNANDIRTRPWHHLGDISLEEFWQLSRDLYNGYVEPLSSVEDEWKSRAFKKKTRRKVLATVASFVASNIGVDFSAVDQGDNLDRQASKLADDIYEWSLEREDFDMKELRALTGMTIEGSACLFEELAWDERKQKEIIDIDFETGEVKWEEKDVTTFKGPRCEQVKLEEIYIGDAFEPEIQNQPYVIRRKLTTFEDAEKYLAKYDNWKYVKEGHIGFYQASGENEEQTENESQDSDNNDVEILYYWNKSDDMYAIVANGVLLTKPDYPIPYPHKEYPFSWSILETFGDTGFFWGNSLPFVNKDDQEITNSLWRMFVDSVKLSNKPPLFTDSAELAGTDLVVPGTIGLKETDETVETIPEIAKGVNQGEFNVLTLAEKQIDENTVDPLLTGQSPTGDPTATEVNAIVGSAQQVKGVNEKYIGHLLIQHAHLRLKNLFWFLTHDEDYRKIVRDRVKTKGGKTGYREIKFASLDEIPSPMEMFSQEVEAERMGKPYDVMYVDKDKVNDYRFHISMSPTPKPRRTSTSKLMRAIQKYQFYAVNPLIDQLENTTDLVEAMGDDPEELVKKPEAPQMLESPQTTPMPSGAGQMAQAAVSMEQQQPQL